MDRLRLTFVLAAALPLAALAACSGKDSVLDRGGHTTTVTTSAGGAGGSGQGQGGDIELTSSSGGGTVSSFDVQPDMPQIITVAAGQTMPTVGFSA